MPKQQITSAKIRQPSGHFFSHATMVEICKMTSPDYLIEINAIAVIAE